MARIKPKEREQYIIRLRNTPVSVSKEVYQYWYYSKHKMEAQRKKDKKHGVLYFAEMPEYPFAANDDVEEEAMYKILVKQLLLEIDKLQEENKRLIRALYYDEMSERAFAKSIGVSHTAVQKRKKKLLQSLKEVLDGKRTEA